MSETSRRGENFETTNQACPPHLFDHVLEALGEWGWLVPRWVEFVRVSFDPEESGTIQCQVVEEYRTFYVRILNGWTKIPEGERGRYVMHELLHAHTNHVFMVFHELLDATTNEGEPLQRWATEQARKAIERTTNDLESVLWNRLKAAV